MRWPLLWTVLTLMSSCLDIEPFDWSEKIIWDDACQPLLCATRSQMAADVLSLVDRDSGRVHPALGTCVACSDSVELCREAASPDRCGSSDVAFDSDADDVVDTKATDVPPELDVREPDEVDVLDGGPDDTIPSCVSAVDCNDENPCTSDSCLDGSCSHEILVQASCDDGDLCTLDDACDDLGACVGASVDCSNQTDACNAGVCVDGACVSQPVPDGTSCDDDDPCTVADSCAVGSCGGVVPGASSPVLVSTLDITAELGAGKPVSVLARGSHHMVYVGVGAADAPAAPYVALMEASDPAQPQIVGQVSTLGTPYDLELSGALYPGQGGHLFVADSVAGVLVINVSNPSTPTVIGSLSVTGQAKQLALKWPYLFVGTQTNGVRVIDVTDATQPVEVGSFSSQQPRMLDISVSDRLFVADGGAGVRTVDISVPEAPAELLLFEDVVGFVEVVRARSISSLVYVGATALSLVDYSNELTPSVIGELDASATWKPLDLIFPNNADDYVYVVTSADGLRVIDVTVPTEPIEVLAVEGNGSMVAGYNSGSAAYVVGAAGLMIFQHDCN